jgi:predicted DNA binding CopG/RHH family protein
VTIRLTEREREALDSNVEKRGEPMAVLIRQAMEKDGLFDVTKKRGT